VGRRGREEGERVGRAVSHRAHLAHARTHADREKKEPRVENFRPQSGRNMHRTGLPSGSQPWEGDPHLGSRARGAFGSPQTHFFSTGQGGRVAALVFSSGFRPAAKEDRHEGVSGSGIRVRMRGSAVRGHGPRSRKCWKTSEERPCHSNTSIIQIQQERERRPGRHANRQQAGHRMGKAAVLTRSSRACGI
jgi:hypothetical protein